MKYSKSLLSLLLLGTFSCTDLEPELYSELTPETNFNTEDATLGSLLQNYTNLKAYTGDAVWPAQELSTETSAAPAKFGPWDDGGVWARLHRHEWEPTWGPFNGSWNLGYSGIAGCNRTIDELTILGGQETAIAEMRALRAVFYWLMIDMFGDVPLEDSFVNGQENPSRAPRAEVFQFIVNELTELLDGDLLSESTGGPYYGRMNRWSAMALLTKVYLNAEVYTGTPAWTETAAMAEQLINSGQYELTSNYFENFQPDNRASSENIFVIPYDKFDATGFNMHMRTLHPLNQLTYNFTDGPWNGFVALQEFYNSFEEQDNRKAMFIVGQQYDAAGNPLRDPNGATEVDSDGDRDPDGELLIFTPEINELTPKAFSQSGARIGKFEFEFGLGLSAANDFPIFRYADILLMRAEALWRMDSGSQEAAMLVGLVRQRAGLEPLEPLTEDDLYHEIQRELAFEAHSRPTMIRFDKFTGSWWEKGPSDANHKLFPIPSAQLNANPNLTQNPGY